MANNTSYVFIQPTSIVLTTNCVLFDIDFSTEGNCNVGQDALNVDFDQYFHITISSRSLNFRYEIQLLVKLEYRNSFGKISLLTTCFCKLYRV